MRDEGMLEGKDWMHFLGTSKLNWACMLTSIQRELRQTNPNLTISFDCASPFLSAANGLMYTDPVTTSNKFSYPMESFPDEKYFKGSDLSFPAHSPIGDLLTMGDVCVRGQGETNKHDNETKTSWDTFSYGLIMAHNTANHIQSVIRANQLADIESARVQPNINSWKKLKSTDKSDQVSDYVPRNILYFNAFVKQLFAADSKTAMKMLDDNHRFLDAVSNNIKVQNSDVAFNTFFDMPDESKATVDTMDEAKLDELENLVKADV